MFELLVRGRFSAAHHLCGYRGDCARVHGHTWEVECTFQVKDVDSIGMGVDFRNLKSAVRGILEQWDHRDLNELPEFRDHNPTAENLAKMCFDRLTAQDLGPAKPKRVAVWESEDACATYLAE